MHASLSHINGKFYNHMWFSVVHHLLIWQQFCILVVIDFTVANFSYSSVSCVWHKLGDMDPKRVNHAAWQLAMLKPPAVQSSIVTGALARTPTLMWNHFLRRKVASTTRGNWAICIKHYYILKNANYLQAHGMPHTPVLWALTNVIFLHVVRDRLVEDTKDLFGELHK